MENEAGDVQTGPITLLLASARTGDPAATGELFQRVYDELKKLARAHRRRWRGNDTMNTTALIHEAFIKLAGQDRSAFQNRAHFYATASQAMRQILVNYAQMQRAAKRGAEAVKVPLDEATLATEASADELLVVHELLSEIEKDEPRRARIVECRIFGGMSIAETAEALEISVATVKREWRIATARLFKNMNDVAD